MEFAVYDQPRAEALDAVRDVFVDIVAPEDFSALGRAMAAVNAVAH